MILELTNSQAELIKRLLKNRLNATNDPEAEEILSQFDSSAPWEPRRSIGGIGKSTMPEPPPPPQDRILREGEEPRRPNHINMVNEVEYVGDIIGTWDHNKGFIPNDNFSECKEKLYSVPLSEYQKERFPILKNYTHFKLLQAKKFSFDYLNSDTIIQTYSALNFQYDSLTLHIELINNQKKVSGC